LNRLDEAKATLDEALGRKMDLFAVRIAKYYLAFLQNDSSAMRTQVDWARDKPGSEDWFLFMQSSTEAYHGRIQRARDLTQQAVDTATRNDAREVAASYEAYAAVREAEFGDQAQTRRQATAALRLFPGGRDVRLWTALALAQIRDPQGSEKLVDRLNDDFPHDTLVQQYWLPTIRGTIELSRDNPSKAIELLQATSAYELSVAGYLIPALVRGQAFLLAKNGPAAITEFNKFVDHPGIVLNWPFAVLARLQLGRAYAMSGDIRKAKSSYQDFFSLWKDADPDIPILKQAKAEYSKLE